MLFYNTHIQYQTLVYSHHSKKQQPPHNGMAFQITTPKYVSVPGNIVSVIKTDNDAEMLVQTRDTTKVVETGFYVYNTDTDKLIALPITVSNYESECKLIYVTDKEIGLITYNHILVFKRKRGTWSIELKYDKLALPNWFSCMVAGTVLCTDDFIFIPANQRASRAGFASFGGFDCIKVFNNTTIKLRDNLKADATIVDVAICGNYLYYATKTEIHMWNAKTLKPIGSTEIKKPHANRASESTIVHKIACNAQFVVCLIIAQFNWVCYSYVYVYDSELNYIREFGINSSFNNFTIMLIGNVIHINNIILNTASYYNLNTGCKILVSKYTYEHEDFSTLRKFYVCKNSMINATTNFLAIQKFTTMRELLCVFWCLDKHLEMPMEIIHNIMLFLGVNIYR